MSNMSALIADDISGPACDELDRGPDASLIATGPHAVPIFWVSMFDESHIETFEIEADEDEGGMILEIPSLVAETGEARRLLAERREIVLERFPEFRPTWVQFAKVIERLEFFYIKVDVQELWDIAMAVEEDFTSDLHSGVRWFISRDEADFDWLLRVASITGYDRERRTYTKEGAGVPRSFHMRGYAGNDRYWDNEADT
jgi:hypothetical protein